MSCTQRVIPEPLPPYYENGSPFRVLKQRSHSLSDLWICFLKDDPDSCLQNGLIKGQNLEKGDHLRGHRSGPGKK